MRVETVSYEDSLIWGFVLNRALIKVSDRMKDVIYIEVNFYIDHLTRARMCFTITAHTLASHNYTNFVFI